MSFVQDSYFRLFASEREPVRKSSFIFFGGEVNQKTQIGKAKNTENP